MKVNREQTGDITSDEEQEITTTTTTTTTSEAASVEPAISTEHDRVCFSFFFLF